MSNCFHLAVEGGKLELTLPACISPILPTLFGAVVGTPDAAISNGGIYNPYR